MSIWYSTYFFLSMVLNVVMFHMFHCVFIFLVFSLASQGGLLGHFDHFFNLYRFASFDHSTFTFCLIFLVMSHHALTSHFELLCSHFQFHFVLEPKVMKFDTLKSCLWFANFKPIKLRLFFIT